MPCSIAVIDGKWCGIRNWSCDRIVLRQRIFGFSGDLVAIFDPPVAFLAQGEQAKFLAN